MFRTLLFAALIVAASAGSAFAHVTLRIGQAQVGTAFKATFRVPHGCAGKATTVVRIRIPDGILAVVPAEKAGWSAATVAGAYAGRYRYNGAVVAEGVRELSWSGGSLPDGGYDEFSLDGFIAAELAPGTVLYFPVVQVCEGGAIERWIEIPPAGKSADDLEKPAPALELL